MTRDLDTPPQTGDHAAPAQGCDRQDKALTLTLGETGADAPHDDRPMIAPCGLPNQTSGPDRTDATRHNTPAADPDPPTDAEIADFLTGHLDPARRFAVADHLAASPLHAAEAMADLRLIEGLRLTADPDGNAPPATLRHAVTRLERRLGRDRAARRIAPVAASAVLFALGWAGHATWQGSDAADALAKFAPLAETALDARDALKLHRALARPAPRPDPQQVAKALDLTMPSLPPDWQVRDVQVVATPERPGLAIIIDTPGMGEIMLFSVVRDTPGPETGPSAFDYRGNAVAVFERARSAYVLVDNSGAPAEISRGADQLLRRFN